MKTIKHILVSMILFVAFNAGSAETYGTAFRIDLRTPTQPPYDHCTLDGHDDDGDIIYVEFPVPPKGDFVQDLATVFKDRPHPLIFNVTCYDKNGNAGLPAEPSGRNDGPGQPMFLDKMP